MSVLAAVEMATAVHKFHGPINGYKTGSFCDEGSSGSFFACPQLEGLWGSGALGLSRGKAPRARFALTHAATARFSGNRGHSAARATDLGLTE